MAATHILVDKQDEVTWSADFTATSDKATLQTEYTDNYTGWKTRCPRFGTQHPEETTMYLVSIKPTREPGNMIRVRLGYESFAGNNFTTGGSGTVKRYAGEPTLEEVSILASDYASALDDTERIAIQQIINGAVNKDSGEAWADDVSSTEGLAVLAKVRKGTTSVLEPGFQWVETFVTSSLSDFELANIGKIESPPGNPPSGGSRNYLRFPGNFRMTADGTAWEMEKRWQLSGKEGWDSDLYDTV